MPSNQTFIGREDEINTFSTELEKLYSNQGFFKKLFRQNKNKISSKKVFLLFGDGGFGKTTLLEKFLETAETISKKHKDKPIVLNIDWDDYFRSKSTLPNTNEKMLSAIFEMVTSKYKYGSFPKYIEIRNKAKKAQEHAEKQAKKYLESESTKKIIKAGIAVTDLAAKNIPILKDVRQTAIEFANAIPEATKQELIESAIATSDYLHKLILDKLKDKKSLSDEEYSLCLDGGERLLSKAFVEDFVALCKKKTVILAIDTYELVDEIDLEKWFRESFLKEIYSNEDIKCITILSGRNDHTKNYRNSIPTFLNYIDFEKLLLTNNEISKFAEKEKLELTESEIKIISDSTFGIPLAVRDIFDYFQNDISKKEEILNDIKSHTGTFEEVLNTVSERFLKYCKVGSDIEKRIFQLCMLLESKWEMDLLISLWGIDEKEVRSALLEMSSKHSFLKSGNWTIHKTVLEFMRNFLQTELDPNKNSVHRNGIIKSAEQMSEFYAEKVKQMEEEFPDYEKLYLEENYLNTLKQYLNTLLWKNKKEFFQTFQGYFLESIFFAKEFGFQVIKEANCFKNSFSTEEKRQLKILEDSLGQFKIFYDYEEYTKPRPNELKNLVKTLKTKNNFNEFQKALLEFLEADILAGENKIEESYQKLNQNYEFLRPLKTELSLSYFILGYYFLDSDLINRINLLKDCQEKAIELNNKLTITFHHFGVVFNKLKEYDLAIKFYNIAIDLEPRNTDAFCGIGVAYNNLKQYNDAIQFYNKAIEIDSKNKYACHRLGGVYFYLEKYNEAIESFKKATLIDPNFSDSYIGLGIIYNILKKYNEAIQSCNFAVGLGSKNKYVYYCLGDVYNNLKNHEEAIKSYNKVIDLDSNFYDAYIALGEVYNNLGNYFEAEKSYKEAIKINQNNPNIYNDLGILHENQKEYKKAIQFYLKAIDLDPTLFITYKNIGDVYRKQKKFAEAILYFEKAIQNKSNDENRYFSIALTYSYLKDFNNSIEYYKKTIKIDSTKPNQFGNLSQVLFITSKTKEAIEALNQAFKLNPTDTDLLAELWFYTYAHIPEKRNEAETKLNELLEKGAISEGWDFSENIKKAIEDGHPNPEKLKDFAKKISGLD